MRDIGWAVQLLLGERQTTFGIKKWEQQTSSKCIYKLPGMIHQGTGIFGGNEILQSHTFAKL